VQTPHFGTFQAIAISKAMRTSDFILGLWAHQAFCFTTPMFEAIDSFLSEVVAFNPEV